MCQIPGNQYYIAIKIYKVHWRVHKYFKHGEILLNLITTVYLAYVYIKISNIKKKKNNTKTTFQRNCKMGSQSQGP